MYDWIKTSIAVNNNVKIYTFDCRPYIQSSLDSLEASHRCIEKITRDYPPPYTLYLSGGVDSQAMLYAWHTSGVPYKTFSARFENDLNDYDIQNLEIFAGCHEMNIQYYDVSVLDFFQNEHDIYAHKYLCGSPQITFHMKLIEMTTEGTCIMSGELLTKSTGRSGLPHHNNTALFHFRDKTKQNFVPFFFMYTKDLAYSCQNPQYKIKFPNEYLHKVYLYHLNGYPVLAQPDKFTGFEKIKQLYDISPPKEVTAIDRIKGGKNKSTRNFDILHRNKYEAKFLKMIKYNWLW